MNMLNEAELKDKEIDRLRSEVNRMRDVIMQQSHENKLLKEAIVKLSMKMVGVNG